MATMAAMPDSTSSSSTNGAPISPTKTTAVDGRQLISSPPLQLRPRIDTRLLPLPQISRPKKQKKSRVSRILWPAAKSASNMDTTKDNAAAEPPLSLLEVTNADNTMARQALAPDSPNSRSSPPKPASFAMTTIRGAGGDGLSDPSAFKTPARSITSNVSEPPPLIKGKKRSKFDAGEVSPIASHRLEKRRMRPMV